MQDALAVGALHEHIPSSGLVHDVRGQGDPAPEAQVAVKLRQRPTLAGDSRVVVGLEDVGDDHCRFFRALSLVLGACGGGAPRGGGSATGGAAGGRAVTALLAQTFGPNPKAVSGVVSGTIGISVKGIPRFSQPVSLTTSGPFTDAAGTSLPDSDQSVGIDGYGGGMTTSGDKVYFDLGTAAYAVPAGIAGQMRAAVASAHNGLMRAVGAFDIRPDLWVRNPRIVGNTMLGGVDVVRVSAAIDTARVFLDASRFTHFLTSLQVTQLAGLPQVIGPAARAALGRSVRSGGGDLLIGSSDHVLREARMHITLVTTPADRKLLGGIAGMTIDAQLDVTEVGQPQTITVLSQRRPYHEAALLLGSAAYRNRTPAERGR